MSVVQELQQRHGLVDFHRIEIPLVVVHMSRNILFQHGFVEHIGASAGAPAQDDDIPWGGDSPNPLFSVVERGADDSVYQLGDISGLRFQLRNRFPVVIHLHRLIRRPVVLFQKNMCLRLQVEPIVSLQSLIQLRIIVIPRHNPLKNIVDVLNGGTVASEILVQVDDHGIGVFFLLVLPPRIHENLRVGLPEPIDTLFYIAHLKEIVRPSDFGYEVFLQLVGVLIFIDKNKSEPLPKGVRHFRVFQNAHRDVLDIAEVHQIRCLLLRIEPLFELLQELQIIDRVFVGGIHLPEPSLRARVHEFILEVLDALLVPIPQIRAVLLDVRVFVLLLFLHPKGSEFHRPPGGSIGTVGVFQGVSQLFQLFVILVCDGHQRGDAVPVQHIDQLFAILQGLIQLRLSPL